MGLVNNFNERRSWFDNCLRFTKKGHAVAPPIRIKHTCPCCGYPTLTQARSPYEICYLCFWEDDGQDDQTADEVWGGPNGDYSLAEARRNFNNNLIMYAPDRDTRLGGADNAVEIELKRSVIDAFDTMINAASAEQTLALWKTVFEKRRLLRKESDKKFDQLEKSG